MSTVEKMTDNIEKRFRLPIADSAIGVFGKLQFTIMRFTTLASCTAHYTNPLKSALSSTQIPISQTIHKLLHSLVYHNTKDIDKVSEY